MHEEGTIINVYLRNRYQMTIYIILVSVLCSGMIGYFLGHYHGSKNIPLVEAKISSYNPTTISSNEDKPIVLESISEIKSEEPVEEIKPEPRVSLTNEEIDLLALITMAEAEGESDKGKRLVIDTILNRVDHARFPDSVRDVIYQPGQFEALWNGRSSRCYVKDDIRNLVLEELETRTNSDVIFFRTGKYSDYGSPLFKVGNHYFSRY